MKKSIIIAAISAASAILLAASCQKQEKPELNGEGKTFTAVIDQELTKTTITGEYKVNWVEGDQIDINSGSIFSATPDATDATKASFTKVSGSDPDGEYGYTAVYPASIIVSTQPTLPATQTYAEGKFNVPMCAMSSTESFEFKNFCGVLCFALKGTDKVRSIAVKANEQICGPFDFADATTISFSGENVGKTVTLDCGSSGVQLDATTATNFYIYLPPATYTAGMKITITNTDGEISENTTTKSASIARSNIYTFNWTPAFAPVIPEGALSGVFSVSATKKVFFSKGGLYYDGSAFKFEGNQYDFPSTWSSSHVGHFYWSKDATVACAVSYSESGTTMSDMLFTNAATETAKAEFTVNGVTGKYRTLSSGEWQYLFNTDRMVNGKPCYSSAVSGISIGGSTYYGVFLYPDNYNEEVVSSSMTWEQINAAGIAFLPAAGYRGNSSFHFVNSSCTYWTSYTFSSTVATSMNIASGYYAGTDDRGWGCSIRLVTDVK